MPNFFTQKVDRFDSDPAHRLNSFPSSTSPLFYMRIIRLSWRSKAFPANSQHWTCPEHRQSLRPARAVAIVSVRREASRWSRDTVRQLPTAEVSRTTPRDHRSAYHRPPAPQHSPYAPPGPLASPQTIPGTCGSTYDSRKGRTSKKGSMCPMCKTN